MAGGLTSQTSKDTCCSDFLVVDEENEASQREAESNKRCKLHHVISRGGMWHLCTCLGAPGLNRGFHTTAMRLAIYETVNLSWVNSFKDLAKCTGATTKKEPAKVIESKKSRQPVDSAVKGSGTCCVKTAATALRER